MIAIGFAVAWAGYYLTAWGYCLVRDYNVTPVALLKTTWPGGAAGSNTPSSQVVPSPSGQPTTPQRFTGQ